MLQLFPSLSVGIEWHRGRHIQYGRLFAPWSAGVSRYSNKDVKIKWT
jgi:hypothetical protein